MKKLYNALLMVSLLLICQCGMAGEEDLKSIPREMGLPVNVKTSINFLDVKEINENEKTFEATVDTKLIWLDNRLSYDKSLAPRGFIEYRNEAATKKLDEIWRPFAAYKNRLGDPISEIKNLRIYPNGTVNYLRRMEAKFSADFDLTRFPFDSQYLAVNLISRTEPINRVVFTFTDNELSSSNSTRPTNIDGWDIGNVILQSGYQEGLRGTRYPELTAKLLVKRQPFSALATIIIPLICCLLIPLLVVWLNTLNHEEHAGFGMSQTDLAAFPMSGIFAVVALNFTLVTSNAALGQGDNPVVRLFAINYIMLAISFFVTIFLYRYYFLRRFFGRFIQEEFFHVLCWGTPMLCFGTVAAVLALAVVS